MIKKWLDNIMPKKRPRAKANGALHHKIQLPIHSRAAEKVLAGLHQAGFEAYLVGGAVRDLLLGIIPKDYDIATNATPEQVHQLFRRSRIIGRRFQIVHVNVGAETIEVSTFRSGGQVKQNEHGRIMQDNAYGTMTQDAQRRDFTCNALYYDVHRNEIIDYHRGIEHIQARQLVMIGEPSERYQEDPVRMLRAVRLSGKLDFTVSPETAAPIAQYAPLLRKEPVARLFDELLKILFSGYASRCLQQLDALGVHGDIHPMMSALLQAACQDKKHIGAIALQQTDQRLHEGKSVSIGFVLAALFWQELNTRWHKLQQQGHSPAAAINQAINQLWDDMERSWGIPQRYTATMREIWLLQPQFHNRRGARPFRLIAQARFRAAYDFLLLRVQDEPEQQEIADWWMQFQRANDSERQQMANNAPQNNVSGSKKRRRKPRKRSNAS